MQHGPEPAFVFALALGAGVVAQVVARHLRVPSIVPLLATGVLLGPDGLRWIDPDALGDGLVGLVMLAVAVVLFEGGLNLDLRRLRRAAGPVQRLVTMGAAITAVGGALSARLLMGWSWTQSILFGTLVIVTGPTVVRPILRNVRLRTRLATIVEAEGVLIDPVGAIIAAVALQVLVGDAREDVTTGIQGLGLRLGFGTLAGLIFGFGLGGLLRLPRAVPEGLENIVTLGLVLVLFQLCEAQLPESGILAVTVAGVVVGNVGVHVGTALREFQDNLTLALIALLFVLLAADVRMADVVALGLPGLATVGALMFVVRPVMVFLSTTSSELSTRERAFLSWVGPRGIVAASVASIFATFMDAAGAPGGTELRALVFLTIAVTVVVQGASAPLVAKLFGVRAPVREGVTILGAEDFGLALGEALRRAGLPVGFLDANPGHCRNAQERNFPVVYGNALEERTLARARLERVDAVVGLTANDEVNSLFAQEARESFQVPQRYAVINTLQKGVTPEILARHGTRMLFDGPTDVERWNVRFRHELARIEPWRFVGVADEEEAEAASAAADEPAASHVLLAVRRNGQWQLMHRAIALRPDDIALIAIHTEAEASARKALDRRGFEPAPDAALAPEPS